MAAVVGLLLAGRPVGADSLSRGSVSVEARAFNPDDEESTEDVGTALTTKLEISYEKRPWTVDLRGVARLDALDSTRNAGNIESAYVMYSSGPFTARIGSAILNWSATEAFHPADVINSRNYDSDPETPEKIGEPMVEVRVRVLDGYLSAYYMPLRLPSKVNGPESRLSLFPPEVELGDDLWVDRDGTVSESVIAHQAAVQVSQTFGPADIAVHVVDHNDRNMPSYTLTFPNIIRPSYHWVTQVGMSATVVASSLILKVEAAKRFFVEPDPPPDPEEDPTVDELENHEEVAVGLEYGWTTEAGYDSTVLLEGQWLNKKDRDVARDLDIFQGDALVAYRLFLNDIKGKEIRLALIADVERPSEYVAVARYNQALTDVWSIAGLVQSLRLLGHEPVHGLQLSLQRNF